MIIFRPLLNHLLQTMETEVQETNQIKVVTKKAYSICQKVFCCRCFHFMRADDESMLTSDIRKQTFQRMIRNFYLESNADTDVLFDQLKFMIIIYLCQDKSIPHKLFQRCRLNPSCHKRRNRTDMEFYLPQICNFLVFHQELKNDNLIVDLLAASKISFFFAHLYYFYMNSLSKIVFKNDVVVFHQVIKFNEKLMAILSEQFQKRQLIINQWFLNQPIPENPLLSERVINDISKYGTVLQDEVKNDIVIQASDIFLTNYVSIYTESKQTTSFQSTITFFDDLFKIADDIKKADPRSKALKHLLKKVNQRLPAVVYIPFVKSSDLRSNLNMVRLSNVLNIVWQDCKVFSTKQRAPYYICIQTYNPSECLDQQQKIALNIIIDKPISLKLSLGGPGGSEGMLATRRSVQEKIMNGTSRQIRSELLSQFRQSCQTQILNHTKSKFLNNKLLDFSNSLKTSTNIERSKDGRDMNYRDKLGLIFGEVEEKMRERIKSNSIYSHLKSWNLVHIMVKTGDNLKQEQFALQLISQFNYIFKLQNLPLLLTPYEVLSMGPDFGILEMVKQTVTIDSLLKKIKEQHLAIHSLRQFFQAFYTDVHDAKKKFMQSLSAYSLVMYFLQVKDRHNGNILLHRNGKIVHIDFGFLLSNAPGKGVQLQKSVPFKLNSQYVQVMDGIESSYFEDFRKLFFQGFQAARKHQDRILILVKMMYSSHGSAMPCFQKGESAIRQLQQRFNPPEISNDLQLSEHCQKLINLSLDNWATRWYDKWQYWAQGILY